MADSYEHFYGLRARAFEPASEGPTFRPLGAEEIEPYLRQRLLDAGWKHRPALDPGLAPLLHEATGGEPGAIDRAMTALLDEAAAAGEETIDGDRLAAWLDRDQPSTLDYEVIEPATPDTGLAEAQIAAIEDAFAEHDRMLTRLRRELADLRDHSGGAPAQGALDARLVAIEARLDQQEAALRHVLERLIAFFEEVRT